MTQTQMNLPPGMTPASIMAALQFLAAQSQMMAPRPSGLLTAQQIRGVNPNYRYEYHEYPKALTPPEIDLRDAAHERQMRILWKEPLPWQGNEPIGAQHIENYYAMQEYPKKVQPPQVIVQNPDEEATVKAAWRAEFGVDAGTEYPTWVFHVSKGSKLVHSAKQREALGAGWYLTPSEVIDAAKGITPPTPDPDDVVRKALLERADAAGAQVDVRWPTAKIRVAVETAEAEALEGASAPATQKKGKAA